MCLMCIIHRHSTCQSGTHVCVCFLSSFWCWWCLIIFWYFWQLCCGFRFGPDGSWMEGSIAWSWLTQLLMRWWWVWSWVELFRALSSCHASNWVDKLMWSSYAASTVKVLRTYMNLPDAGDANLTFSALLAEHREGCSKLYPEVLYMILLWHLMVIYVIFLCCQTEQGTLRNSRILARSPAKFSIM